MLRKRPCVKLNDTNIKNNIELNKSPNLKHNFAHFAHSEHNFAHFAHFAHLITDTQNKDIETQNNITNQKCKKIYKCDGCGKFFSRNYTLIRHQKTICKNNKTEIKSIIPSDIEVLKTKFEQNENKILELEKIVTSKKKHSKKKHTKNINSKNNITINNKLIVNFGEEDIRKLTRQDKFKILRDPAESLCTTIKKIHANKHIPEYNNIYISNLKSNIIHIMHDGRFIAEDREKGMLQLLRSNVYILERILEETKHITQNDMNIMRSIISSVRSYKPYDINEFGFKKKMISELVEKYIDLKKRCEIVLYNNKNLIEQKMISYESDLTDGEMIIF
jgi:hypothetical protein